MNQFAGLVTKARKLFDEQKYKEATKSYFAALDHVPDDADRAMVWAELCWTFYKDKSFREVIEAAENVLEFNPQYEGEDDLYRLMGYSYFALENDEMAEEFFLKSLKLDSDSEKQKYVFYELGKLYFRNQRYVDAEKYLDKAETYFQNNAKEYWISLIFFKGFAKYYLKKIPEAEVYFNQLIENAHNEVARANGFYGLAYVYFDKKKYLETINMCEQVAKLNTNFFDMESIGFLTAASFFYLGRFDIFKEYFFQIKKSYKSGRYIDELARLETQIPGHSTGLKN
jgi:tetratricopeptide (TPR) repeat protein